MTPKHRLKQAFGILRLALGSILGIVGFGTISLGLLPFKASAFGTGVGELAVGTVLALGVLTPMRGRRPPPPPPGGLDEKSPEQ